MSVSSASIPPTIAGIDEPQPQAKSKFGIIGDFAGMLKERWERKKLENEKRLLRKEEQMKQDIERFLMECEERNAWCAYELNKRNYDRMVRLENIAKIRRAETKKEAEDQDILIQENGLMYSRGQITSYRRWQNSAAKHLDLRGHTGAVYSCKLSKCLTYIISCSADNSARIWWLRSGRLMMTYEGHKKKVTDCDIHPNFSMGSKEVCVVTCSADKTLRFWSTASEKSIKVLRGHHETVYRCCFSPDGQRVVSCSEDFTVRTWCCPDGYVLYVYRAHKSPVTSVCFSPTGRYILSASDYGERKLLMWDSGMPRIEQPAQFAHMIFWTTEGLIKKILIKEYTPDDSFWLSEDQLDLLGDDFELEVWPGELDPDIIMDSDSDKSNSDDEEEEEDTFGKDDVRENEGAFLGVIATDSKTRVQSEAFEYIPGGSLVISVQTSDPPITEAFLTVVAKDTVYDMFPATSGQKIGYFKLDYPPPWEMGVAILDPLGIKKPRRAVIPDGLADSKDGQSCLYIKPEQKKEGEKEEVIDTKAVGRDTKEKESQARGASAAKLKAEDKKGGVGVVAAASTGPAQAETAGHRGEAGNDEPVVETTNFTVVWMCPAPNLGPAMVVLNMKRKHSDEWIRLNYSLKESVIRINTNKKEGSSVAKEEMVVPSVFDFDQEERHVAFWDYVREKKWNAVEGFLDKKSVLYYGSELQKRKWRVVRLLERMFGGISGLVVPCPFIYSPGLTKSVAIADEEEVAASQLAYDADDGEEVGEEEEEEGDASDGSEEEDDEGEEDDGDDGEDSSGEEDDEDDVGDDNLDNPSADAIIDPYVKVLNSNDDGEDSVGLVAEMQREEEDEEERGGGDEATPLLGDGSSIASAAPVEGGKKQAGTARKTVSFAEKSEPSMTDTRPHHDQTATVDDTGVDSGSERGSKIGKHSTADANDLVKGDRGENMISPTENRADNSVQASTPVSPAAQLGGMGGMPIVVAAAAKPQKPEIATPFIARGRSRPQNLRQVVFTDDIMGKKFQTEVSRLATEEALSIQMMRLLQVPRSTIDELRVFAANPKRSKELQRLPATQPWLELNDPQNALVNVGNAANATTAGEKLTEFLKYADDILAGKSGQAPPQTSGFTVATHDFLQSTLFGPSTADFSMSLPEYFPTRAGQAKHALNAQLQEYRRLIAIMDRDRVPTTLAEARELTWMDKIQLWIERRKLKKEIQVKLEAMLRQEISYHLLSKKTYLATRRNASAEMKAFLPHYPNPHYGDPALVFTFPPSHATKNQTMFGTLFGKPTTATIISPPVGRKPENGCTEIIPISVHTKHIESSHEEKDEEHGLHPNHRHQMDEKFTKVHALHHQTISRMEHAAMHSHDEIKMRHGDELPEWETKLLSRKRDAAASAQGRGHGHGQGKGGHGNRREEGAIDGGASNDNQPATSTKLLSRQGKSFWNLFSSVANLNVDYESIPDEHMDTVGTESGKKHSSSTASLPIVAATGGAAGEGEVVGGLKAEHHRVHHSDASKAALFVQATAASHSEVASSSGRRGGIVAMIPVQGGTAKNAILSAAAEAGDAMQLALLLDNELKDGGKDRAGAELHTRRDGAAGTKSSHPTALTITTTTTTISTATAGAVGVTQADSGALVLLALVVCLSTWCGYIV